MKLVWDKESKEIDWGKITTQRHDNRPNDFYPNKEEPCAKNERKPMPIMSCRSNILEHEYTRKWGEPLKYIIGR